MQIKWIRVRRAIFFFLCAAATSETGAAGREGWGKQSFGMGKPWICFSVSKNNCLRAYELYTMPYHECVKAMMQQQQQHGEQEQQQKQDMIDKLLFWKKELCHPRDGSKWTRAIQLLVLNSKFHPEITIWALLLIIVALLILQWHLAFWKNKNIRVSFFHLPTSLLFYNNNLHWHRNGKKK